MMFAPASVRRLKKPSGTSGERERVSMTRNAAIRTAEPMSAPIVCPTSSRTFVRLREAEDEEHEARCDRDRAGGVEVAGEALGAALPDVPRHEEERREPDRDVDEEDPLPAAYSVRMPPSRTPMAAPEPAIAPRMPSALFRSAPSRKVTSVIEKTDGERIAPAAPWRRRIAISIPEETREPAEERGDREERRGRP